MEGSENARVAGIDLTKTIAILFVVCTHFFLNTMYYATPLTSINLYFQAALLWLFIVCVPLFIMSTGYLNYKKTPCKSYFIRILRILVPYLVISMICLVVRECKSPGPVDWKGDLFAIFNFKADPYSWYVNMFIGLYLIAPFLNAILHHLERKKILVFIGVLFFLSSLPVTFDPIFLNAKDLSYFYFPDFWQSIYPLIYYFIGAYIAKYKPRVSKTLCASAAVVLVLLQTAILILAQPYLDDNWLLSHYGTIFIVPESVCVFLLLYNADIRKTAVRRVLKTVSSVTLEIYLFSYLADSSIYPYIVRLYPNINQEQFFSRFFLIGVILVFGLSLIPALLLQGVYRQVEKAIRRLYLKKKKTPVNSV